MKKEDIKDLDQIAEDAAQDLREAIQNYIVTVQQPFMQR